MLGDIIFVKREPLLWRSTENRRNINSKKLDICIYRVTSYTHYGIDMGNGNVAHFQADSFWLRHEGVIKETPMEDFVKDGKIEVLADIPYAFSRSEVVKRAKEALNTDFGGYSVLENNCEHFAMWCATGMKASKQYFLLKSGFSYMSRPTKHILSFASSGVSISKSIIIRK